MAQEPHSRLSRRERQIMDVVYRKGQASAAEIQAGLPDPPSYSAVRALLRILEDKGHLKHKDAGGKYIYAPTHRRENAGLHALKRVVRTFYDDSLEKAVAALMGASGERLTTEQVKRLQTLIEQSRKEDR